MIALLESISDITLFGVQLINVPGLVEMFARFLLNSVFAFTVIHF